MLSTGTASEHTQWKETRKRNLPEFPYYTGRCRWPLAGNVISLSVGNKRVMAGHAPLSLNILKIFPTPALKHLPHTRSFYCYYCYYYLLLLLVLIAMILPYSCHRK